MAFASNPPTIGASTTTKATLGEPICELHQVLVPPTQKGPPTQKISIEDLTFKLKDLLKESGMKNGVVNVFSRHTTTAIAINERESRLTS